MKAFFKNLSLRYLPAGLAGTSFSEVGVFLLVIVAIATASHYVWGESTTTYLWLLAVSLWAFLHIRKSKTTWDRFDEVDQRDLDFKDEFDRKYNRLSTELEEVREHILATPLDQSEDNTDPSLQSIGDRQDPQ